MDKLGEQNEGVGHHKLRTSRDERSLFGVFPRGADNSTMNLPGIPPPGCAWSFLKLEMGNLAASAVLAKATDASRDKKEDLISAASGVDGLRHSHRAPLLYSRAGMSPLSRTVALDVHHVGVGLCSSWE